LIWKKTYHKLVSGHSTTTENMEEILTEEGFFDQPEMLPVLIAKFMNHFRPIRSESSLLESLKQHPKFYMIESFLAVSPRVVQQVRVIFK